VEAGADTIEHPLPRSEETIQLMAKKGVAADPTLIPYQNNFRRVGQIFWIHIAEVYVFEGRQPEMLKRLRKAGIKCGVGTDLILHWYRYMPGPYIRELKNSWRRDGACRSVGGGDENQFGDSGYG